MASWQQANTGAFLPSTLTGVISTAQSVAGAASAILGVINTALDLAKAFIIAFPPFDWAAALAVAIGQFKNDFLATGFYMLNMWDYPLFQYNRFRGVVIGETFSSSFEKDVIDAFFDAKDINRPTFSSNCAALILVTAAPDIDAITNLAMIQRDSFTWWAELNAVADRLQRISMEVKLNEVKAGIKRGDLKFSNNPSEQTQKLLALNLALQQAKNDIAPDAFETNIRPIVPTIASTPAEVQFFIDTVRSEVANPPYPNFEQTSLRTIIPALPDVFDDALDPLLASLATGRSIEDALEALIDALDLKIEQLTNIVDSINLVLQQVENLLTNTTLSALFVTSNAGMAGLASEIENATNKPLGIDGRGYFSGIVLIGGGPGITQFQNLFGPIGS